MGAKLAWMLLLTSTHFTAAAGNQVLLRNIDFADGTPKLITAGGKGNLIVVSTVADAAGRQISRVIQLDRSGARLKSRDIEDLEYPSAAVADAQGNVIVTGLDANLRGLVLKLDAQLEQVLFSKSLPASVNAAAVSANGDIYLTGSTSSAVFPLSAGAYQTSPPVRDNFGSAAYAFLMKLSGAGDILYSTYFGDSNRYCDGGSFCVGKYGVTSGTGIAVDASGAVVIAGTTTASQLPTTPNALYRTCACGYYLGHGRVPAGFVAKFQPGTVRQLLWATYLNAGGPVEIAVNAISLTAGGDVILAGQAPPGLPTTPGALQPTFSGPGSKASGYVIALNSPGTAVVWGTYFRDAGGIQSVWVDAQGRVLFSGYVSGQSPSAKPTYVARLTSDGSALTDLYEGAGVYFLRGPALTVSSGGLFASVTETGALWIETAGPGPSLLNLTNSSNGLFSPTVAPSELITLYGVGIGPDSPQPGRVEKGVYPSSLAGSQVLFDGVAAPLIYADAGQINAVVPRGIGPHPRIQVVTQAGVIDGPTLRTALSPALFEDSATGWAAALNQDGSINSPSNPARPGTIVTVFATGAGTGGSFFPDGAVVPIGIYDWSEPVVVLSGNRSLEVTFAGNAPGLVNGVTQVNFRLPEYVTQPDRLSFRVFFDGVATPWYEIPVAP